MMCQRMGRPPISTIGLGRNSVSSRRRVPNPPHRTTTFIFWLPGSAAGTRQSFVSFGLICGTELRARKSVIPHASEEDRITKVTQVASFEGRDPNWSTCAWCGLSAFCEGDAAMAEEAEYD